MKKFASILAALVLTISLSITAFAADGAIDPQFGVPLSEVAVAGSSIGSSSAQPAAVITGSYIMQAISTSPLAPIYIKSTKAILTKEAIIALRDSHEGARFIAPDYNVSIEYKDIVSVTDYIDLSMNIYSPKNGTVNSVSVPDNCLVISPAAKGDFGLNLGISVSKEALGNMDTSKIRLYYISDDQKVHDLNPLLVFLDRVGLHITHASVYVISDTPLTSNVVTTIAAVATTAATSANTTKAAASTTKPITSTAAASAKAITTSVVSSTQATTSVTAPSIQTIVEADSSVKITTKSVVTSSTSDSIIKSTNVDANSGNIVVIVIIVALLGLSGIVIYRKIKKAPEDID